MYLKRLIQSFAAIAALLSAQAVALIEDPEVDFIKTPEDVRANWGILPKPEIKRLDLDLTGEGRATIFLAYKGVGSKGGTEWTAYHPMRNGYVRTYGIQFREDFSRAGKIDEFTPDGGLMLLYPGKGGGVLCRIKIELTGKLTKQEVMELDYSNSDHQQLFERVFGRKLGEPMPDEFFKKPTHQVIEVKAIEARAASKPNSGTAEAATNETSQKVIPQQFAQPPAPKIAPEVQSASTPSEEPASSTPWSVIVVLIVAATGLLWLLVKKRK